VQDITERKERERHFEFMRHELSHRSKNLLAVVQAITHHTMRATASPEEFEKAIVGRIQALAAAHDLLLREDWRGAEVLDIVQSQLRVFADINPQRITISGPDVTLQSGAAQELSICIYELTTNALKYGALSTPRGRVSIIWSIDSDASGRWVLNLSWTESGGPPVTEPTRRGFGSNVLRRAAEASPTGGPSLLFLPDGVQWSRAWRQGDFYLKPAASESAAQDASSVKSSEI
jgi:two-component sensor histidine kinase